MKDYSIGELAALAGVSRRMLHYYDEIGLLEPANAADTGYRCYGVAELLRLPCAAEAYANLADVYEHLILWCATKRSQPGFCDTCRLQCGVARQRASPTGLRLG